MFFLKKHVLIFLLLITSVFGVLFFSWHHDAQRNPSFVEKLFSYTVEPLEFVLYTAKEGIVGSYESYIGLKNAREQAIALRKENDQLKGKLNILDSILQDNDRLRKLLEFKDKSPFKLLACEIIDADPTFVYKNIRINKGKKDGVQYGMGVMTTIGVVGIVIRVYEGSSDVLLLTDPNSNMDVIVARDRRRGILQGGISANMEFKYFERGNSLLVGDEIVTSGLTGAFPAGIPIGKVVNVIHSADSVSEIVHVEPAVDFTDLNEALILMSSNHEVDVITNQGGADWIKRLLDSNSGKSGG